jgi:tRNA A-37 threonylcarbamoyl transferase component Bud32
MLELKATIGLELKTLNRLKNSDLGKTWPPGLSVKDALDYGREGIRLDDVKCFKEQGLAPAEARKSVLQEQENSKKLIQDDKQLIEKKPTDQQSIQKEQNREVIQGIKDAFKKKESAESFEKQIHQVLDEGKRLRTELRLQDKLTENDDGKIQKLMVQAEFATKAYVDLFIRHDALPKDMQELSHAALENQLGQLPMANLPSKDMDPATQLLDLIHENTSLVHLKYQDFDKRFAMPEYATKTFGHQEGHDYPKMKMDLESNQKMAKTFSTKLLTDLISPTRAKSVETLVGHVEGLLCNRPDLRIALSLLNDSDRKDILSQTINRLTLLDKSQKEESLSTILKLTEKHLPNNNNLTVGDEIGDGGSGIVYSGLFNGNPVVIKASKVGMCDDGINYSDKIIEALRQAELRDSPYTPKILGFKAEGTRIQTIIDKVDGGDYKKLIKNFNNLKDRATVGVHCISGVVKGLEFLHQRQLVHCDLKPENVMFDSKMLEPRLIDFGICAKQGETSRLGTAKTWAPEVSSQGKPEPASDIYSLGCTLYELITGKPAREPIDGMKEQTDFSSKAWQTTPLKECRVFIEACMREDPKQRPMTGQILQALRGDPVSPASPEEHGLKKGELGVLDLFKPEKGYSLQAKELLASKVK